jgi:hypothetical protein
MDTFGYIVLGLVVGTIVLNVMVYLSKSGVLPALPKAGAGAGGGLLPSGLSLDSLMVQLAGLITKVKGDVTLSYPGRQAIRTIMLFVMVCLDTLPDSPEKDECKKGARAIDAAFFDPPQARTPAQRVTQQAEQLSRSSAVHIS